MNILVICNMYKMHTKLKVHARNVFGSCCHGNTEFQFFILVFFIKAVKIMKEKIFSFFPKILNFQNMVFVCYYALIKSLLL